jgi:hypothetical protein
MRLLGAEELEVELTGPSMLRVSFCAWREEITDAGWTEEDREASVEAQLRSHAFRDGA